jgi:hypothetical protein
MTAPEIVLYADTAKPDTTITWLDASGAVVDYSTGYTLQAHLVDDLGYKRATVTCTGRATAPNVLVPWGAADLSGVSGLLRLVLVATDAGGDARYFRPDSPPTVLVRPVPATPPVVIV